MSLESSIAGDQAVEPVAAAAPAGHDRNLSVRQELLAFLEQLDLRLPRRPLALQLIGPRGGEGASTLARELARVAASREARVVLLRHPGLGDDEEQAAPAGGACAPDLESLESVVAALSRSFQPGRPAELVLGSPAAAALRDSKRERERLVQVLKQSFELVLFDAPAALSGNDGVLLAAVADGVVLVIEAEVTRRPVAKAAIERLRDGGANLLGLLFNKRRQHIPDAVYRLL